MSTLGIFDSSNWAPQQLKREFASTILTKYPGGTVPLTALSAMMEKPKIFSHKYEWGARTAVFPVAVTSGIVAAATVAGEMAQIPVVDASTIVPGAVLKSLATNEQLYVESVLGATSLLVRRGFGSSPGMAIPSGARLVQIGNANEEASLRPMAKSFSYDEIDNITQIFRNSWAVSGTVAAEQVDPRTGQHVMVTNKRDAAMFHAMDMELARLFGERHQTTKNGKPLRHMDGIISQIQKYAASNVRYAGNTTTFKQLGKMVNGVFDVSTDLTRTNDRMLLTGNRGYAVLNELGRSMPGTQVNITQKENSFGMRFTEFMTDVGNFKIMVHPLLNLQPEWSAMALVIDPSSMAYPELRPTVHNDMNKGVNTDGEGTELGEDAEGGTFLTECTTALRVPEANAVVYGLCQAAQDIFITAPETFEACFSINRPCADGPVEGGSTVILSVSGSKPSIDIVIATPTGNVTIDVDAQGAGSATYTMPVADGVYAFALMSNQDLLNVSFASPVVMACVAPCVPGTAESHSADLSGTNQASVVSGEAD